MASFFGTERALHQDRVLAVGVIPFAFADQLEAEGVIQREFEESMRMQKITEEEMMRVSESEF